MCVPCSANKCRIRESDLQAAYLYIIFLNWYNKAASRRQYNYRGMQEKVTQQVGCVENPTSPQAVWNVGFINPIYSVIEHSFVSLFLAFHYSTARRANAVRLFFWIGMIYLNGHKTFQTACAKQNPAAYFSGLLFCSLCFSARAGLVSCGWSVWLGIGRRFFHRFSHPPWPPCPG